jgi:hypothetical protein
LRKTPAVHAKNAVSTPIRAKATLTREADAAQQLRLRRKHAGEQKKTLEQLLFAPEGHGQQARMERNTFRQIDRGGSIGQDDFDGAGGGFGSAPGRKLYRSGSPQV